MYFFKNLIQEIYSRDPKFCLLGHPQNHQGTNRLVSFIDNSFYKNDRVICKKKTIRL